MFIIYLMHLRSAIISIDIRQWRTTISLRANETNVRSPTEERDAVVVVGPCFASFCFTAEGSLNRMQRSLWWLGYRISPGFIIYPDQNGTAQTCSLLDMNCDDCTPTTKSP